MTCTCVLRIAALLLLPFGAASAQEPAPVVHVHIGLPRLQEFVQAGKNDALRDSKNGQLRVYYCNTPGWHRPPELQDVKREQKDMKALRAKYGVYVAWPSADPTSIEGTEYLCPYVEAYNCTMQEEIRKKFGVAAARRLHAYGLPCT